MKKNKYVIIDLETGGLDPSKHAICSITIKIRDKIKTWYIMPYGKKYDDTALKVNGLSLFYLNKYGNDIEIVKDQIKIFLNNNCYKDKKRNYMVGHNLQFDLKFLDKLLNIYDYTHYHYYDTMNIALYLRLINRLEQDQKVSLSELYKSFFGKDKLYNSSHTSHADVLMTEKLFNIFKVDFINIKHIGYIE